MPYMPKMQKRLENDKTRPLAVEQDNEWGANSIPKSSVEIRLKSKKMLGLLF